METISHRASRLAELIVSSLVEALEQQGFGVADFNTAIELCQAIRELLAHELHEAVSGEQHQS